MADRQPPTYRVSRPSPDNLRRDRELAFNGSEDLTPSEFYRREHAEAARADASWVVERVERVVQRDRSVQRPGAVERSAPERERTPRAPNAPKKRGPSL